MRYCKDCRHESGGWCVRPDFMTENPVCGYLGLTDVTEALKPLSDAEGNLTQIQVGFRSLPLTSERGLNADELQLYPMQMDASSIR